jgi:hypothetical protein
MIDNAEVTKGFANVDKFGDKFSRALPCVESELNVALPFATICALYPQALKTTDAAFIACSACFDSFANPHFFLCQELIETCILEALRL